MRIEQFGKSGTSLMMQKKSFFDDNVLHLEKQRHIREIYIKQPLRINCKNCNAPLNLKFDFIKDEIEYKICNICSHLNGAYEDTDEFCDIVYTNDDGKDYALNYEVESIDEYNSKVSSIYLPKAEFLYTSLMNDGMHPNNLKYLDFGAGSGYFTAALKKIGLNNVFGSEISKHQVAFGNKMLGANVLSVHDIPDTNEVLKNTDADVVSMIGVLEHAQNPRGVLQSIKENENITHLYISVPLFSLSVYLEMLPLNVFHRQLHGGHTHLYTEKSLHHMCNEFGFDIASQWWFGTDIIDLYRNIYVSIKNTHTSNELIDTFQKMMMPLVDSMQLELDKKHCSSEVHLLLTKK